MKEILTLKEATPKSLLGVPDNKVNRRIAIVVSLLIFNASCATPHFHEIRYEIPPQTKMNVQSSIPARLGVTWFNDKSRPVRSTNGMIYNERARYVHQDLGEGISKMLAEHLRSAGIFESVLFDKARSHEIQPGPLPQELASQYDLLLAGEVTRFEGWAEQAVSPNVSLVIILLGGIIGGLIYLAVTRRVQKSYGGQTSLSHLRLIDTRNGNLLWEGQVEGAITGSVSGGVSPYRAADQSLREAAGKLIGDLEGLKFSRPEGGSL